MPAVENFEFFYWRLNKCVAEDIFVQYLALAYYNLLENNLVVKRF